MIVKIEVQQTMLRESGFADKRTGEWRPLFSQTAYLHIAGKPYPTEFEITLPAERKGKPYEQGMYTLAPDSFYIDARRFNKLTVNPVLLPIKQ